mmetsp:Transcript_43519/g.79218  ORF Transcript_43519/g.79218 Transcript_43519/m.79218 type:complete len:117 (-) Transcript_43519:99-449(-)
MGPSSAQVGGLAVGQLLAVAAHSLPQALLKMSQRNDLCNHFPAQDSTSHAQEGLASNLLTKAAGAAFEQLESLPAQRASKVMLCELVALWLEVPTQVVREQIVGQSHPIGHVAILA